MIFKKHSLHLNLKDKRLFIDLTIKDIKCPILPKASLLTLLISSLTKTQGDMTAMNILQTNAWTQLCTKLNNFLSTLRKHIIVYFLQWDSGAQYYTTKGIKVQSYRIIYAVPLDLLHLLRMFFRTLYFLPGRQSSSGGAESHRHRSTQTQRQSESATSNKHCAPSAQGLLPKIGWTEWMFALLLA